MGTRIHKTLGWGFKYCRFKKDPRFNEKFFGDDIDYLDQMVEVNKKNLNSKDLRKKMDAQTFDHWINGKGWASSGEKQTSLSRSDIFNYNSYIDWNGYSIAPVIFTDPSQKGWSRYDDIIDYYDAPSGKDDNVKFILDGAGQPAQVYPYCSFVNRHTGKRSKENITPFDRWSITNFYFEGDHSKWKWKEFKKNWGVKNIVQWQRDIVPEPPYVIRLFCKVAKPFKNPLTMYRLKPMIFTYWC
jgi:hypothetical protein